MIKDLALALTPSAPARLKGEDKKFLRGSVSPFVRASAMMSATKELMRASSRLRTVLSNKARRGSLCMPVLASPVRRGNGGLCTSMHHLGVAAVRSCDAGLVDHTECPETVSICKRTVARAACPFQYVLVELRLCLFALQN
jgi:hypothetical protein